MAPTEGAWQECLVLSVTSEQLDNDEPLKEGSEMSNNPAFLMRSSCSQEITNSTIFTNCNMNLVRYYVYISNPVEECT